MLHELMDGELEEMMDEYDEEEALLFEGYMKQNPDAEARLNTSKEGEIL
ncbi:hypothetical protein [Paenibacillus sp. JDR-2]|nr:hypothetical protein [Paenibacillus sp. JDR-2]ACT01532.1 hypothetical protein Pjdr2_2884 [Paenibacillus sp. JDR-2]